MLLPIGGGIRCTPLIACCCCESGADIWFYLDGRIGGAKPNTSRMSFNLYGDVCSIVNFHYNQIFGGVVYFECVWSGVRPGGVLELLFTLV